MYYIIKSKYQLQVVLNINQIKIIIYYNSYPMLKRIGKLFSYKSKIFLKFIINIMCGLLNSYV